MLVGPGAKTPEGEEAVAVRGEARIESKTACRLIVMAEETMTPNDWPSSLTRGLEHCMQSGG